jgi:hypothetical protein
MPTSLTNVLGQVHAAEMVHVTWNRLKTYRKIREFLVSPIVKLIVNPPGGYYWLSGELVPVLIQIIVCEIERVCVVQIVRLKIIVKFLDGI